MSSENCPCYFGNELSCLVHGPLSGPKVRAPQYESAEEFLEALEREMEAILTELREQYNEFTWQVLVDKGMERYGFEFDNDVDLWLSPDGNLALTNAAALNLAATGTLERYLVAGLEP